MANSPDENPTETKNPDNDLMDDDAKMVCTATPTTKIDYDIGQEMEEIIIQFKIPHQKGQSNIDDFQLCTKLMRTMTTNFDDTKLCFTIIRINPLKASKN
jgi:hypothetical protein